MILERVYTYFKLIIEAFNHNLKLCLIITNHIEVRFKLFLYVIQVSLSQKWF